MDFAAAFGFGDEIDFSASFGFCADFGLGFDNFDGSSDGSYRDDILSHSEIESSGGGRIRQRRRRRRRTNRLFRIESVKTSCWYRNFTRPGVTRELTHELSSSDRFGDFRQFFRMPLSKVEMLTNTLIDRGYVPTPRTKFRQAEFRERTELLVMSAIYLLANGAAFRSCRTMCGICTSEVRKFFYRFLHAIVDMKEEYIYMPRNITELSHVSSSYADVGLPGCCGSMDVVHIKWGNCPSGDYNRAKGKEKFPSLGFQCLTDFNRRIISIYGPHFGTRNDMDIVKTDTNVDAVRTNRLFRDAKWKYFDEDGRERLERGMYLICDNGYLRWPTTICPFTRTNKSSAEGFFSTNIESVQKDVECTFGILKKRWKVLNNGFYQHDIKHCEKIFITCCVLNNYLSDLMERSQVRVGRGAPDAGDGIWLSGPRYVDPEEMDRLMSVKFTRRRSLLVKHLYVARKNGRVTSVRLNRDD